MKFRHFSGLPDLKNYLADVLSRHPVQHLTSSKTDERESLVPILTLLCAAVSARQAEWLAMEQLEKALVELYGVPGISPAGDDFIGMLAENKLDLEPISITEDDAARLVVANSK